MKRGCYKVNLASTPQSVAGELSGGVEEVTHHFTEIVLP